MCNFGQLKLARPPADKDAQARHAPGEGNLIVQHFKAYKPTPNDALAVAAHRIRRRGWRQTGTGGAHERLCLVGSVLMLGLLPADTDAAFAELCRRLGAPGRAELTAWNDAPERTARDVLALLERVAT